MLDFQAIKASVSILDVANGLGLKLKQEKDQFRTACPACEGDPRSIVITPEKNLFYCFASSKGGDQISLMAHIRGLSMKEAAAELAPGQQPEPKPPGNCIASVMTSSRWPELSPPRPKQAGFLFVVLTYERKTTMLLVQRNH